MSIKLIGCLAYQKNGKFIIGINNKLAVHISEDLRKFRAITQGHTVIMGRKTWESLPRRPLKGRTNIVLTNSKKSNYKREDDTYFMSFRDFKNTLPLHGNETYFVIGGSDIYNLFMEDNILYPTQLILTVVKKNLVTFENDDIVYFDTPSFGNYNISGFSENLDNYRYIYYSRSNNVNQEYKYLNLMDKIMEKGVSKSDRTGVGTLSLFGESLRFDISNNIPLLTTKRTSFKNILEELLWFCRGDTNSKILESKGVNIWKGNSSREFLDSVGLLENEVGDLGEIYGKQWRNFGDSDIGFDQLKYVEDLLKNDPFSRRIMISAWNPNRMHKMALPACHFHVGWNVTEENGERYLSCYFTMRSSDCALASCYNVVSYTILTYILAKRHGMKPKEIVYNAVDCHIYNTHVDAVKEQLSRNPRPFPCLVLSDDIVSKDWKEISCNDFELVGYFPHTSIKMEMAV